MPFKTETYFRRPFQVEAVQITDELFEEIAEWANGKILQTDIRGGEVERYIFVNVHTPMHERQKMGFVGDWVLKTDKGFKIYMDAAFHKQFVKGISIGQVSPSVEIINEEKSDD